ncbi:MAG TPA: hypothetical protein VF530_09315 [Planctomycetota bacterium]
MLPASLLLVALLAAFARICWFVEQFDLERLAGSYRASPGRRS